MASMSLTRNPDRDSLPAELLREYELVGEDLLGEGAFAVVRLMRHIQTGELFALKCIEKHPLRIRNMISQMQREVRIQHSLVHPNIVRLVRTFDEQAYVYMLLEYCGKGTLRSLLQQQPHHRLAEPRAAKYFEQIVRGIECMHRNSYVHRDLKLENMLLTDNDVVKICDFGWSAEVRIEEMLQTTCGTTSYWAPEIWEGALQDEAVDLWALGCLLYEVLAGHAPFYEQDQIKLKRKVLAVEFGYPPWLSNEVCHAIHVLLQRKPASRAKAADLLKHPWLSKYREVAEPVANSDSAAPSILVVQQPKLPVAPGTPGPPRRLGSFVAAQRPQHFAAEDGVPRCGSFVFPLTALTTAYTTPNTGAAPSLAAIGRCHSVHATPPITPVRAPPRTVVESTALPSDAVGSIQMRMVQVPPISAPARDPTMRQSLPRAVFAAEAAAPVSAGATTPSRSGQIISCRFASPARRAMTPGPDRRSASPLPRSATQAGMAAQGFTDSASAYPGFFQSDQVAGGAPTLLPTRTSMVLPVTPVGLVLPAPQPVSQPSPISASPAGPAMPIATAGTVTTSSQGPLPQSPLSTTRACASSAPGATSSLRSASPAALRAPSPGALRVPSVPSTPATPVAAPMHMSPSGLPATGMPLASTVTGLTAFNAASAGLPRSSSGKVGPPGNSLLLKPQQRCGTSFGLLTGLPVPEVQGFQAVPGSVSHFGASRPPLFA
mmetsp:Transcript_38961/g.69160  ORF Transcript_38961/g.69160 Transcript_38961/m.69160 type:complete len:717 (-) Transcript_38961:129-2279(-)